MTTNHPEKLDPALIRPGRIDLTLKLDYIRASAAIALLEHYFAPTLNMEEEERIHEPLSQLINKSNINNNSNCKNNKNNNINNTGSAVTVPPSGVNVNLGVVDNNKNNNNKEEGRVGEGGGGGKALSRSQRLRIEDMFNRAEVQRTPAYMEQTCARFDDVESMLDSLEAEVRLCAAHPPHSF